ncbi:SpoIIAA family protein [Acinetobacter brisouii]
MMTFIQGLPENVIGITASGHISASDYETILVPAIEAALAQHGKIRVLYHIADDFSGFTPGAMWDDMKLGLGHLPAWERMAIVTDVNWVAHATSLFKFIMPCPVQVFALSQLAEAKQWICS